MISPTSITDLTPKEKPTVITSSDKKNIFKFSFVNPKVLGAMTVLLLMIGGVGTGVYLIQKPQQTTSQASLSPVNLNLQPGEIKTESGADFTVDVFANASDNKITGADLDIKYNPAVLTLKSITPKDFLPKILVPPKIASGSASVSLGTDDGASGVSGNGVIASLLFTSNPATTAISSEIAFNSSQTQVKILNQISGQSNVVLGISKVSISPAKAQAATTPSPSPIAQEAVGYDFNGDGQVNSIDLSLMYSAWGNPDGDTQKKADINGDGVVNGMDYSGLLPNFKQ